MMRQAITKTRRQAWRQAGSEVADRVRGGRQIYRQVGRLHTVGKSAGKGEGKMRVAGEKEIKL